MKIFKSFILLLIFPSLAIGQAKPKIVVEAPDKVERDEGYVQVFVNVENKDELPANVKLKFDWIIREDGNPRKQTPTFEGGTTVLIPTRKTKVISYQVVGSYSYDIKKPLRVTDKDDKTLTDVRVFIGDSKTPSKEVVVATKIASSDKAEGQIEVEGSVPLPPNPEPTPTPPDPGPTPNPDPSPTFPDGKFGLSKVVYDLAMSRVKPASRTMAAKLAESYEEVAKKIATSQTKLAAGVPLLPTDLKLDETSIQKELKTSNATAMGASASDWQDWDEGFKDAIYSMYENNVFSLTPDNFKTAYKEIALGLKAVK